MLVHLAAITRRPFAYGMLVIAISAGQVSGQSPTRSPISRTSAGTQATVPVGRVRAYDSDRSGIRASQLRRDADLSSDDNVTILIDSRRDRRGAFLFRTNPNGAMWDAQLVGLDNLNENWNGVWEVATARDSVSWTPESLIPMRTLRRRTT